MEVIISFLSLFGWLLNFSGALILALNACTSRRKIIELSGQILPVLDATNRQEKGLAQALDEAIERMPRVQYLLWQSNMAIAGLIIMTIGFFLQLPDIIVSKFCS